MTPEIFMVLAGTAVVVFGFLLYTLKSLLIVGSPNEVIILSGGAHAASGKALRYRAVRGGRVVRIPLLEVVDKMDLSNIPVDISVSGAYSKGGIPLNVQGVAHVKLPGEEPRLSNAVERFLGRSRQDIAQVARETLEGNVRGVLAQLTPEEVNQDKAAFAHKLLDEAEQDMFKMGLVLDTLKIQNVTDDANYLNSIGRIQGARVRMEASVIEAKTQAEAAEQRAANWASSETAKINADLAIARQETEKRVRHAQSAREAMIQEARGEVQAQVTQVKAEIERQKARALQVERQQVADVIQPAEADRRRMEEQARGAASKIIEVGRAEGEALRRLVEEYKKAGPKAREVLVLQQVMPLAATIAGAQHPVKIKNLSILPSSSDGDPSPARRAVGMAEELRAATGVDLAGLLGKLGGQALPAPAPAPASAAKARRPQ